MCRLEGFRPRRLRPRHQRPRLTASNHDEREWVVSGLAYRSPLMMGEPTTIVLALKRATSLRQTCGLSTRNRQEITRTQGEQWKHSRRCWDSRD